MIIAGIPTDIYWKVGIPLKFLGKPSYCSSPTHYAFYGLSNLSDASTVHPISITVANSVEQIIEEARMPRGNKQKLNYTPTHDRTIEAVSTIKAQSRKKN